MLARLCASPHRGADHQRSSSALRGLQKHGFPVALSLSARHGGALNEIFFLESFKGQFVWSQPARQRGDKGCTQGMGPDYVPIVVVQDRESHLADFQLDQLDARHVKTGIGHRVVGVRCQGLSHHVLPQAKGADGATPWSRDPLPEELSGLAQDAGTLRQGGKH